MSEIEKNQDLCKKYPFLIPRNRFSGEVVEDYDYSYTELDAMPDGWRKAFGEKMCEEIQYELEKIKLEHGEFNYCILQIKEKYGSLRWYTNYSTEAIDKIVRKYEKLSERICINCGAAATKISLGWISPYCDECAGKVSRNYKDIEAYFNEGDDSEEDI